MDLQNTQTSETHKCFSCKKEKPRSEFHKQNSSPSGLRSICKECVSEYQRERNEKMVHTCPSVIICVECGVEKPSSEFNNNKRNKTGKHFTCKECTSKKMKKKVSERTIIIPEFSVCTKCGKEKASYEFYRNSYRFNGLSIKCKDCIKEERSTTEYKELFSLGSKIRHLEDPRKRMFNAAKGRAKKQNLPFTITLDDVFIPTHCPILGIPLEVSLGSPKDNAPSLDKVIPELGYIPGNISVISYRANTLKNNASIEELESIVAYMKSFDNVIPRQMPTKEIKVFLNNSEPNNSAPKYGAV